MAPGAKLHVLGEGRFENTTNELVTISSLDGSIELSDSSDNYTHIDFKNLASEDFDGRIGYHSGTNDMGFLTAGTTKMTITSDGNLDVAGLYTISSCPSGTTKIYNGLCIDTNWRAGASMPDAAHTCHSVGGRVSTYGELGSACKLGIAGCDAGSINGKWIGNNAGDDQAYCGNGGDCNNFEGTCNKGESKQYKCSYGPAGGSY